MPYVEKTGLRKIKEQLWQWESVMHDPNLVGYNGWGCKQKIYEVLWSAQETLEDAPNYVDEEEFLKEHDKDEMIRILKK